MEEERETRGTNVISLAGATLVALGLTTADASAAIRCEYEADTHVLSVTVTEGDQVGEETVLRRVGDRIWVGEFLGRKAACHGSPTVVNTDQIRLKPSGLSEITIDLSGGPLAPGASVEPDSSPEIEILALGKYPTFWLEGGSGDDHFRYMSSAGQDGLNLNALPGDDDIDLIVPSEQAQIFVDGRRGADTIDVVPPVNLEVAAFGGSGNDTLLGAATEVGGEFNGGLLEGGAGRDRIIGSPLLDLILPGSGADVVSAEGGSDDIQMTPDKRRDKIDCGRGNDHVERRYGDGTATDPIDRFRSCEHIKSRK